MILRRKLWVALTGLRVGMVTKHMGRWVYINTIDPVTKTTMTRRAVVTLMHASRRTGGTVVFFPDTPRRVLRSSIAPDLIDGVTVADDPNAIMLLMPLGEPTERAHVQRGVHNSIAGDVNGPTLQAGNIDGQTVTDFFKKG